MRTTLCIVGLLALAGCDNGSVVAPSDLVREPWRLVSFQESPTAAPITIADPSRYQLRFHNDGDLDIVSDCNSCNGRYLLSGTTLSIGTLSCTLALCASGSLDGKFVKALQEAETIVVEADEMTIQGGGQTLRFED